MNETGVMAQVRPAATGDVDSVTAIYAEHVLCGTASFEEVPPTCEEMVARMQAIETGGYPWLVAEAGGEVVGYAYAGLYRQRSAYRFTLEDSIYLAEGWQRRGIGRLLMTELLRICTDQGFKQMMAVIGDSANVGSIGLHRAFGFEMVGTARNIGFKFGRWLDVVYMQRSLATE